MNNCLNSLFFSSYNTFYSMNLLSPILSVCIPVKDFNVHPLVDALLNEIHEKNLNVEILIVEDGSNESSKQLNASLLNKADVSLFSFEKNKGRSAARNFMAQKAKGEYLLFIDADSLPVSPSFLSIYLDQLLPHVIVSGGRHYSELYRTKDRLLHWKYGIHREIISSLKSNRVGFQSNNFLISKVAFDTVQFDESLVLYGHEDTLFGSMAKAKGIKVQGIDNPVIHTSLETNEVFLSKSEEGIKSLLQIIDQQSSYPIGIEKEFRLWSTYTRMQSSGMTWVLSLLSFCIKPIRFLLLHFSGPLVLFDFYKLLLLHKGSIAIQPRYK
ncbi:MAG: glycosyltransferase family 2 protein [Chitinophagaceae bacterium]|nr:glycosyltransferase family 2 protein [Chitinophagaceae bacterium]